MKFSRIRDVKAIERGTSRSAGIDFYVPNFNISFVNDLVDKNKSKIDNRTIIVNENEKSIKLAAHESILIPSGIKVNIPEGYALFANNKSGVGSKKGLDRLAVLVDEDYMGEVHINVVNTSNNDQTIVEGEKIIQFTLQPINYATPQEIHIDELYANKESERGVGGFGSTNK